jgi:hypothetical protein
LRASTQRYQTLGRFAVSYFRLPTGRALIGRGAPQRLSFHRQMPSAIPRRHRRLVRTAFLRPGACRNRGFGVLSPSGLSFVVVFIVFVVLIFMRKKIGCPWPVYTSEGLGHWIHHSGFLAVLHVLSGRPAHLRALPGHHRSRALVPGSHHLTTDFPAFLCSLLSDGFVRFMGTTIFSRGTTERERTDYCHCTQFLTHFLAG